MQLPFRTYFISCPRSAQISLKLLIILKRTQQAEEKMNGGMYNFLNYQKRKVRRTFDKLSLQVVQFIEVIGLKFLDLWKILQVCYCRIIP